MRSYAISGAVLLIAALVLLVPRVALACFCGAACDLGTADGVFEATVTEIEGANRPEPDGRQPVVNRLIHLRDMRGLRGAIADEITTAADGGSCGYEFKEGVRYLIVAYRGPDGRLTTSRCSSTRPLAEAWGELEYIKSLASPSTGARLWGRVFDSDRWADRAHPDARPLADVRVSVRGPVQRAVLTPADGRFTFDDLSAGTYTVDVDPAGDRSDLLPILPREIVITDGPRTCLHYDIRAGFTNTIEGLIVDPAGQPLADAFVQLQPAVGFMVNGAISAGESTGASGRYRFTDVPPGRYVAGVAIGRGPSSRQAFVPGYARGENGETTLVMPEAGGQLQLRAIVAQPMRPLRVVGVARRPSGEPVFGLAATWEYLAAGESFPEAGLGGTTGADGAFRLELLSGARYRIRLRRGPQVEHSVEIVADEKPIVVIVPER